MRRTRALICLMLAASALAACGRKQTEIAANAPAKPPVERPPTSAPPPPGPPLPPVSAEGCNLIATYVRAELNSEFGLPLMLYIPPEPKASLNPNVLTAAFSDELNPPQVKALAASLTEGMKSGASLASCDWKAVGLGAPQVLQPGKKDFIRFRTAFEGEVAVLDIFSIAGPTQVGTRCVYRRAGTGWSRAKCVLTALS